MEMSWKTLIKNDYMVELVDSEGWYRITIKRDGCIDYRRYYNIPYPDNKKQVYFIHFCDLDEVIDQLQSIKEIAKLHFGDDWE